MTTDKRRIDACLKACKGISTQNLEDNVPVLELARRYNVVLRERDALREQQEINLSDPAVQQRLAAQWGYVPAGAQPAPNAVAYLDLGVGGYMDVGTDLTDEELATLPKGRHMLGIVGTYGVDGYLPAHPAPSVPDGWKEAAIAWEVCASIHREYGKGKDPFFNTRQGDFVKHTNDARAMLAAAPEAKP